MEPQQNLLVDVILVASGLWMTWHWLFRARASLPCRVGMAVLSLFAVIGGVVNLLDTWNG